MDKKCKELALLLESDLFTRYGPMLGGSDLSDVLGYPSKEAFRQALSRGQQPVPVFNLPQRRGKFALVKDVAAWLVLCREGASFPIHTKCSDNSKNIT